MPKNNKIIGNFGERLAVNYLEGMNFKIIRKNYKCIFGEIDLIAVAGNEIVFTEVKTRTNLNYGYPIEAVTRGKLKRIKETSQYFLINNGILENKNYNFRFDVISIVISEELTDAILSEKDIDIIDISKLRNGIDYNLEHLNSI
ncbi:YraN family protein [bacterium]|nr:YraN family protein [bacterium]